MSPTLMAPFVVAGGPSGVEMENGDQNGDENLEEQELPITPPPTYEGSPRTHGSQSSLDSLGFL